MEWFVNYPLIEKLLGEWRHSTESGGFGSAEQKLNQIGWKISNAECSDWKWLEQYTEATCTENSRLYFWEISTKKRKCLS